MVFIISDGSVVHSEGRGSSGVGGMINATDEEIAHEERYCGS